FPRREPQQRRGDQGDRRSHAAGGKVRERHPRLSSRWVSAKSITAKSAKEKRRSRRFCVCSRIGRPCTEQILKPHQTSRSFAIFAVIACRPVFTDRGEARAQPAISISCSGRGTSTGPSS